MTLIKVKHPIFAPGESREVTGGTPAAATPRAQRPSRGDQGVPKAGRDRARLTCTESSSQQPVPSYPGPLCLHRPARAALYGARPGAAPAAGAPRPCPARPAGATPGCGGEPAALLPSAAGSRRGTRSRAPACVPSLRQGHCGAAIPAPRVFQPVQLRGYHPAALPGMLGTVLGVFQLWAPPAPTAPG